MKSENQLQANCFQWAWNYRPKTRRLLAYNLGNSRNKIDGARNKSMGLIPGRADMELLWQGRIYYFEFKFGYGKQSEAQKSYQSLVESHGAKYFVVSDFDQFQQLIDRIIQ
jgi:hypothetical protein